MTRKAWIAAISASVLLGAFGMHHPSIVYGETEQAQEKLYRIVFGDSLAPEYEAAIINAGGRVTAVSPELRAVEAVSAEPRFLSRWSEAGGAWAAVAEEAAPVPACVQHADGASNASPEAVDLPALDAEWSFQWEMQRYASEGAGGSSEAGGQASEVTHLGPADKSVPFGIAGTVVRAVQEQAQTIHIQDTCLPSGSADSILYRRSLLFAASHGSRITMVKE